HYSFEIDYENDQFLLDGKPFRYIAGSFHYFRVPKQYWKSIFRKIRAAGLNAVTTYVEWSTHEPEPNKWIWDGEADIVEFIKMAQEEDLFVILRPGPYICGERDFGGLPYWLLSLNPDIKLRTNDERFIFHAERYLNRILNKIKPLLIINGGPIIMLQIENEYGSLDICNNEYKKKLYEIFYQHVGKDIVLFTVDGLTAEKLKCGAIPGIYQIIDFGANQNVEQQFKLMREFSPKGPLVNGEYYTGWLAHWNESFPRICTNLILRNFEKMLSYNASLNLYMFYGGTNYGFTSGANFNNGFLPQITSYDYDAPLNEAGDPTPKYFKIRNVISKYQQLPDLEIPTASIKKNYGIVYMIPMLDLFTAESRQIFGIFKGTFNKPPTFESLQLPHWLVLYELDSIPFKNFKNSYLSAAVNDRALVYINDKLSGLLSRSFKNCTLLVTENEIKSMKLLVENQGHINFGKFYIQDFKGISNVSLNNIKLSPWKVTGFKLTSVVEKSFNSRNTNNQTGLLYDGPQFLIGYFEVTDQPHDTFLNTENWGKGVAYMNGQNLGRYWPTAGPQLTLYVPAPFLKKGKNCLILLELEYIPSNRTIKFQVEPILG
ncbi:PREDICTED: beta-galactosidase-like, partial [Ceratosolen solmsi marchali]|uniref:Beta-galactosidase n=1 Tax=Ceratosolen solmsi marchali TaxID=326594 RepID=A0AAJ7E1B8_9HYME